MRAYHKRQKQELEQKIRVETRPLYQDKLKTLLDRIEPFYENSLRELETMKAAERKKNEVSSNGSKSFFPKLFETVGDVVGTGLGSAASAIGKGIVSWFS